LEESATNILERLNADLKSAMKARQAERTLALRMAISAMNYRRIERNESLTDADMTDVLRKQVRQREDSIDAYRQAGRTDLADKEARERAILIDYLPAEMSEAELRAAVAEIVAGLPSGAKLGDAMKATLAVLKGRASGKAIQAAVKDSLEARGAAS